jgi:hypothetical protein
MSAVVSAYLLVAPEGFGIDILYGQISGVCIAMLLSAWFLIWNRTARLAVSVNKIDTH